MRRARINADPQLGDIHRLIKAKAEEMSGVGRWMLGAIET